MLEYAKQLGFVPKTVVWELIFSHGIDPLQTNSDVKDRNTLNLEESLKLCEELAELGCELLTLSGGSPLQHPYWKQIAQALTTRGVQVNFISDGALFDRVLAVRAQMVGIQNANFYLDGMEETHMRIGHPQGNWQKVINNIRLCRDLKMSVGILTSITQWSYPELREMHALLEREGVHVWELQLALPVGGLAEIPEVLFEPREIPNLIPLLVELKEKSSSLRLDVGDNIGYYGAHERAFRGFADPPCWLGCGAGLHSLGIKSNGDIKGCIFLPDGAEFDDRFIEGNVRERSLKEIWNDPEAFAYNRQFKMEELSGPCRSCEYGEICRGGCSLGGFALQEGRDGSYFCHHHLQRAFEAETL